MQLVTMPSNEAAIIDEFMAISGSSRSNAQSFLSKFSFSLTRALERFFSEGGSSQTNSDNSKRRKQSELIRQDSEFKTFFLQFADPSGKEIGIDGIERLSNLLGTDPLDVVWLVIGYHCEAKSMGLFTLEEWARGMRSLDCPDVNSLRESINLIRSSPESDPAEFRGVYLFAFKFALDPGARNISLETAIALWTLLLPFSGWTLQTDWIAFTHSESIVSKNKAITKDAWSLLLTLMKQIPNRDNLAEFDRDVGAWPVMIDEFYDFLVQE